MVKLISLYVVWLKVVVSKNLLTTSRAYNTYVPTFIEFNLCQIFMVIVKKYMLIMTTMAARI